MRPPLSKQKEFRQIKNAVIREAERIHMGEISFEDKEMASKDAPESFEDMTFDYWTLQSIPSPMWGQPPPPLTNASLTSTFSPALGGLTVKDITTDHIPFSTA